MLFLQVRSQHSLPDGSHGSQPSQVDTASKRENREVTFIAFYIFFSQINTDTKVLPHFSTGRRQKTPCIAWRSSLAYKLTNMSTLKLCRMLSTFQEGIYGGSLVMIRCRREYR